MNTPEAKVREFARKMARKMEKTPAVATMLTFYLGHLTFDEVVSLTFSARRNALVRSITKHNPSNVLRFRKHE